MMIIITLPFSNIKVHSGLFLKLRAIIILPFLLLSLSMQSLPAYAMKLLKKDFPRNSLNFDEDILECNLSDVIFEVMLLGLAFVSTQNMNFCILPQSFDDVAMFTIEVTQVFEGKLTLVGALMRFDGIGY